MKNEHDSTSHAQGMPANDMHERLCAYVLGEGTSEERIEIEREMLRSPELKAQRDQIERTIGLVKTAMAGSESLSPEAAETLVSAASVSRPAPMRNAPWLRIAAGIGAVALGFAILRPSRETSVSDRVRDAEVAKLEGDESNARALKRLEGIGYGGHEGPAAKKDGAERGLAESSDQGMIDRKQVPAAGPDKVTPPATKEVASNPASQEQLVLEARKLRSLYDEANTAYLNENFESAKNLCNQILLADPSNKAATELRDVAVESQLARADEQSRHRYREEWIRTMEQVDTLNVVQNEALVFEDLKRWKEVNQRAPLDGTSTAQAPALGQVELKGQFQVDPISPVLQPRPAQAKDNSSGVDYFFGGGLTSSSGVAKASPPPTESASGSAIGVGSSGGQGKGRSGARSGDLSSKSKATATSGPATPGPSGPATGGGSGPSTPAGPASQPSARDGRALDAIGYGGAAPSERLAKNEEALKSAFGWDYSEGDDKRADRADDDDSQREQHYYWQLTPAEQQAYLDQRCRRILDGCRPMPNEHPRDMFFRFWGDNPFEVTALDRLSTFSADVDTASYALARRYLNEGNVPEKSQIRTEEFVNYFKSDVPAPTSGVFAIHTDLTPSRFSTDSTRQMMRVVVRGKEMSKIEREPLHLTFVVDVSGSMREQNRLEMVKHAIRLLVSQLSPYDKIGIVKFSSDASVVLQLTSVDQRALIESAIEPLQPEGSTNSNAGLQLGYAIALSGVDTNSISRVVFLSDGVANVGETDPAKIAERVKPMREKGIYLNTIGVGMNNHNDVLLEQLADKADGMCSYIDSPEEAKKQLVDNFTGAFQPIARDVKIQVEFDPAQVLRYRLLGYENRAIADADFRNDKVDAGELGAGHQVTALYEIERQATTNGDGPLATVRVRWKEPRNFGKAIEQDAATEIAQTVNSGDVKTFEAAGQGYRKAVIAAQFAEILRRSVHARGDSLDTLLGEALRLQKEIPGDADFTELVLLISKSKDLIVRTMPACDELCQAIDQAREANYRRVQLQQLQKEMDAQTLELLKKQNDELEARLRELVKRRLESQAK